MQPGPDHSPAPRHASFLRVTERGGATKLINGPVSQTIVEGKGEEKKPIRPDCYKHFMPRYKMSTLDPVHMGGVFLIGHQDRLKKQFWLLNDHKMLILCLSNVHQYIKVVLVIF